MAKQNNKNFDFQKEWGRTKKQLVEFSKEAAILAKKGEKELVKFTKRSKLHLDSSALALKKEHLYHLIGKEYVKASCPGKQSATMKRLLTDLGKADDGLVKLKSKLTRRIRPRSTKAK